jgi:hypothetical protein
MNNVSVSVSERTIKEKFRRDTAGVRARDFNNRPGCLPDIDPALFLRNGPNFIMTQFTLGTAKKPVIKSTSLEGLLMRRGWRKPTSFQKYGIHQKRDVPRLKPTFGTLDYAVKLQKNGEFHISIDELVAAVGAIDTSVVSCFYCPSVEIERDLNVPILAHCLEKGTVKWRR